MLRSLLISSVLFFISTLSFAQISIHEGIALQVEKGAEFDRVIGSDDKSFYVYRVKTHGSGTHYFVEKYDKKTLNVLFSKDIMLEAFPDANLDPNRTGTWTIMGEDKVYVFFSVYSKKDQRKIFVLRSISKSGQLDNFKEIDSNPERGADFYVKTTPDSSKFLIINELQLPGKAQVVKLTLYNASDFTKLWNKTLPDGYKESGIRSSSYVVNNEGAVAFYFYYMKDFENEEVGGAISVMSKDNDQATAVELDLPKPREPYLLVMKFKDDNELACAGIFRDNPKRVAKDKKVRNAGIFYYFVNVTDMSLTSSGNDYFPAEVAEQLTYKGAEGTTPGEKYYSSSQLEIVDGNYYLLSEHGYDYSDGARYRKEIVVSKISSTEGKVEWTRLLQKNSTDRSGLYNVLGNKGKLYVFCLEHPDVEKRFAAGKIYKPGDYPLVSGISGPNVMAYEIDEKGVVKRNVIYKNEGFCYQPQYQDITLQADNDLLIYMKQGGNEKFGTINVK
jgi:hypothetical protein